ncbi:XVIPCD domain-containing protein [Pseudoxanthomonas wuyuanensis]
MRPVDPRIEPLLAQLTEDPQLPKGAEDNLRQAIAESPYLSNLLANAAADKQIGRIAVSHGEHNGGHFAGGENGKPGTLYVSESNFKDWSDTERLDLLTGVMGHETMHGVLAKTRVQALDQFTRSYQSAMDEAYQARETVVNLTDPVRTYLDKGRQDEALAEVSALRAVNSRLKHLHPDASESKIEELLVQIAKSRCIQDVGRVPSLAPGISYDALNNHPYRDGGALTKAVEQCFYDGKGTLGKHGDSDYRNYYGVDPISRIARDFDFLAEGRRPPDIRIDMKDLGLDSKQLERNGLDLGNANTFTVTDGSKGGMEWVQLKNTGKGSNNEPDMAPNRALPLEASPQLSHADRALLEQIRGKVDELDKANGRMFDEASERMSYSLLAAAKDAGMTRVDHVLLSVRTESLPAAQNLFVVQGDPSNSLSLRADMPTAEAAQRPVQESLDQVESINQRQALEQQSMEQQRIQEQQRTPHMSM